ncbi:hypothetical protein FAES_2521 [Fibrella aestuarina BUZ 2]|uniref:DUF4249 domain-containing protein n=1 Tax=Fibrella aestuarina BUZ 2 TaxID=1166018 RepID=I0K8S7_9BACT|nr:hypothetical protein FAES_2521 [Fibrella aestuarina BUZ 2]
MRLLFAGSLAAVALSACTNLRTEIDPSELPGEPEKIVVYGYISPQDTILSVRVGRSKPVLGDGAEAVPFNINNATVSINNGTQTVRLTYNSTDQVYRVKASTLPIRAGQTYTLDVSTPDGKRVTAQANVPKPIAIQSVRIDSSIVDAGTAWKKSYLMTISWQDPVGEENFYRYGGTFNWNPNQAYPINGQPKPSPVTLRTIPFQRENTTGNLVTDKNQDGVVLSSQSSSEIVNVSLDDKVPNAQTQVAKIRLGSVYPGATVTAQLLHLDKLYYRYANAVINQRRNRDNPFAEPVLIPTNIVGGLGCFVGYNRTDKAILLR